MPRFLLTPPPVSPLFFFLSAQFKRDTSCILLGFTWQLKVNRYLTAHTYVCAYMLWYVLPLLAELLHSDVSMMRYDDEI